MNQILAMVGAGFLLLLGIAYILYGTGSQALVGNGTPRIVTHPVDEELANASDFGFNVSYTMLESDSPGRCYLQQISACDNNEPGQFICANSRYSSDLQNQYSSIYADKSRICPLIMLEGTISCGVSYGYCVVIDNKSSGS